MLRRIKSEEEVSESIKYIGAKFKTTPYLYVNIIKYGLGTERVSSWLDIDENGGIEGIYLLYYDCIHFFTRDPDSYPLDRLLQFIGATPHKVIMLQGRIGDRIDASLQGYYSERNHIIDMDQVGLQDADYRSQIAVRDDIPEIVDLLMSDSEYVNVYDKNVLLEQMLDRFDGGFSRYFVVKMDGKVVATCSTYGEVPGFAIFGGVVVHPEYRRRGLARDVENFACHVLSLECASRIGFVNVNNTASLSLHEKLGAFSIGTLAKFVKQSQ